MNDNTRPEALELVGTVSVNVSESLGMLSHHGTERPAHAVEQRTR
jgi:hypothetical protein